MTAGVADRGMDIGVDTGLGLVRVGMAVLTVRDRVIGTATAVIGTIVMAIVATMTGGGIRLQLLAQEQLLVVRLQLRPRPLRQSIARRPMATAMRMSSGATIVIAPIGPRTIVSSHITALANSVIRHTDGGKMQRSRPFGGGFVFVE